MEEQALSMTIRQLYASWPWIDDFFSAHGIETRPHLDHTFPQLVGDLEETFLGDLGTSHPQLVQDFSLFIRHMLALQDQRGMGRQISSLAILPGIDKHGTAERRTLELRPGEITAIVGPTGAGKSRLLEDIECLAQGDTPTRRRVLVNGHAPSDEIRFSTEERLIAQLSQNMNFVMDLSVEDFLTMHAESRMVEHIAQVVGAIFETANDLAGERFTRSAPITQLSGGQSRSLMIADTALLSGAPVVLIDEIENAGVDKVRALELLVSSQKIVLISTHDPVLALSAHQRAIIQNGGIQDILPTTGEERAYLEDLKAMDCLLTRIRHKLRNGESITP